MTTSRRTFIKNASASAATLTIVPRHVLGGPGFVAPSERLVVAGIGGGGMGGEDLRLIHASGKAEIGYICDVDDRRAAFDGYISRERFPKAKYYKDYREMLDKEHPHIDAVVVGTPDHNHAIQALAAMQLGKHVYVEKPLAHDVWEARVLTDAAKRYKVVTQMGNQGASNDGPRQVREWYEAGVIGDAHTIYAWSDRPTWPHGELWPTPKAAVPKELDWDLWLGTAPYSDYVDNVVPTYWRGYWDYATGALGDMGCHILEAPFTALGLQRVQDVHASVSTLYLQEFVSTKRTDCFPPSAYVKMTFAKTERTQGPVTLHWMDGGLLPFLPDELGPNESLGGNGVLIVGTQGKILVDVYGNNPRLLPTSRQENVPQKYPRVEGQAQGHYAQWVEACIAGYGNKAVSSPFEIGGPLTEAALIANLAVRGADLAAEGDTRRGRNLKLLWDHEQMKVTNFDIVNQFVKRDYRPGWEVNYTL